jgi:hypothetical protein
VPWRVDLRVDHTKRGPGEGSSACADFDSIARELESRGILTRSATKWWPSQIANSLRRPVYTGFTVWSRTEQYRTPDGRRHRRIRPKEQWIWSKEPTHEALIPLPTWNRIQTEMKRRSRHKTKPNYQTSEFILTGLLRCWCGARMHGHGNSRKNAKGTTVHYRAYRCSAVKTGSAYHRPARGGDIEEEVLTAVAALGRSPEFLDCARKRIVLDRMREGTATARNLDQVRGELEEVKRKQGVLYQDRLSGRLDLERWQRFHDDLVGREEDLAERITEEERILLSAGGGAHSVGEILEVLRDFRRVFDGLEMRERKLLLQSIVEGVLFGKGASATVTFHSPWAQMFAGEQPATVRGTTRKAQ